MAKRNANIELLRCVLMLCIVFWHCSMCCPEGDERLSKLLACLPIFSVDAFILISGWYGVSFSWKKVFHLFWVGAFSACTVCVIIFLIDERWAFRFSLGWFGLAYMALLILSPLVNAGLDVLEERGWLMRFWAAYSMLTFVSWLPISGCGIDLKVPGFGGLSFNTMLYVYVTGRLLRSCTRLLATRKRTLLALFIMLVALNVALAVGSGLTKGAGIVNLLFSPWRTNDSPLVVVMSAVVFLLFVRAHFPAWLGNVAVFLAPSMFSVYLLHCGVNFDMMKGVISRRLFLPCGSPFAQICVTIMVTIGVFGCCVVVDLVRRACERQFRLTRKSA